MPPRHNEPDPGEPGVSGETSGATTLTLEDSGHARRLLGPRNEHLRLIQDQIGARIGSRGNELHITGPAEAVEKARRLLRQLYALVGEGFPLYPEDVDQAARLVARDPKVNLRSIFLDTVTVTAKGRAIGPRGPGQKAYLDAIRGNDIVFSIGPAGTGKTYLAMAMAVASLLDRSVSRIILCRPAVEAGEKLGFLPGNLAEKVNPYLRPLYDALHDLMADDRAHDLVERGTIEVAPLAFMRGRTLNDAFVILDEAQNSTGEQMKMFLTRLGFGSKAVVTGDITQVDLPAGKSSGLIEAKRILSGVPGIAFCEFTDFDVVRHPLVQKVIRAYERDDVNKARASNASDDGASPKGEHDPEDRGALEGDGRTGEEHGVDGGD